MFSSITPRYGWPIDLVNGLCLQQIRAGHEVTVMTTNLDWETTVDVPIGIPIKVGEVDVEYYPIDSWAALICVPAIRRFAVSTALARALRRRMREFDVVHVHGIFLFTSLAAAVFAERAQVPYVISPHGNLDPYRHRLKNRRVKDLTMAFVQRRALNRAGAVLYASESERRKARDFHLRSRSVVIDLGLNVHEYSANKQRHAFRDQFPAIGDKRIVLYLGRLASSKGLDVLARAFALCIASDPNLHLVLMGPDDEGLREMLSGIFAEANLLESVTFTGLVVGDLKVAALKEASVFAHPSPSESFGLVLLEAMACGVPLVVSDGVALATELEAAGAAIVVRSEPLPLASALLQVLSDASLADRLRNAGLALVTKRFDWSNVSPRFEDLYESVVASSHLHFQHVIHSDGGS